MRSAAGSVARSVVLALLASALAAAPAAPPVVVSREGWIVGEIRGFAVPPGPAEGSRIIEELRSRGWLECDGRSHAAAEYPALAAMLRETPAAGAAPKTFRVPDLRAGMPLPAGHPLRYLIYAGPPASAADRGARAAEPEAGLTLPPHYRMSTEVRLEGKNPKAAAIIDKDAALPLRGRRRAGGQAPAAAAGVLGSAHGTLRVRGVGDPVAGRGQPPGRRARDGARERPEPAGRLRARQPEVELTT